eukprot:7378558-Prymnesium_polylepis.1
MRREGSPHDQRLVGVEIPCIYGARPPRSAPGAAARHERTVVALAVPKPVARGVERDGRHDDSVDGSVDEAVVERRRLRRGRLRDAPLGARERVELIGALHAHHAHVVAL